MFLDMEPFARAMVVFNTAELGEHIAGSSEAFKYSAHKEPAYSQSAPAMGSRSILSLEGEEWYTTRKKFSPGFQPSHINNLIPEIVQETILFSEILEKKDGQVVKLMDYTSALTVEIIGRVLFDQKMHAQTSSPELVSTHRNVVDWCFKSDQLNPLKRYNPFRPLMLWYYTRFVCYRCGHI
jgi:cytochrome P450